MANSVTEAQSHDEGRGGRSVTVVHRSVMGVLNKHITVGLEKRVGIYRSVTGTWLHSLLQCMVYSWTWECNYKLK